MAEAEDGKITAANHDDLVTNKLSASVRAVIQCKQVKMKYLVLFNEIPVDQSTVLYIMVAVFISWPVFRFSKIKKSMWIAWLGFIRTLNLRE